MFTGAQRGFRDIEHSHRRQAAHQHQPEQQR
ncbi:Uncharacterised protein [Klebsiella pneumoniae]|nr:Uncharacterised protein [Klebsiella pneumoniae]